jgi:hypothetical protein
MLEKKPRDLVDWSFNFNVKKLIATDIAIIFVK